MTMKKIRKLEKDSKKKNYVFLAIINDVKMLKKNNELSSTFKTHALESLKKRLVILLKQKQDNSNQEFAIWKNTKSKEIA